MPRRIRLTFVSEDVSVVADLLEEAAPQTCAALWERLPFAGASHHASYSGSECVLRLPFLCRLAPENATSDVHTGDVCFTWFAAGSSYGFHTEFAEICWFYDSDACPSMPEGPVPVSRFARIEQGGEAFYAVCRRMRREGIKSLVVERVEADDHTHIARDLEHRLLIPDRQGYARGPQIARSDASELLVAFTQGFQESPEAADPRSLPLLIRSADQGSTWPQTREAIGEFQHFGALQTLFRRADGALIAHIARYRFTAAARAGTPGYESYQTEQPGHGWISAFDGIYQLLSQDQGRTWTEPRRLALLSALRATQMHPPICFRDGLLAACTVQPDADAPGCVLLSTDVMGEDWRLAARIADAHPGGHPFTHPTLLALPSGRILVQMQMGAQDPPDLETSPRLFQCSSDDGGQTWSAPRDLGIPGAQPHLALLPDGRLLIVYAHPRPPYALRGAVSADDGETWRDFTLRYLPTAEMGHPSALPLDDGRVLCVYYCADGLPKDAPPGGVCGIHATVFRLS